MTKLVILVVITWCQIHRLTASDHHIEMYLDKDDNKALYGHSFLNISGLTLKFCFKHCLTNCLCLSFQICDDTTECQLCSSNKYVNPKAMHESKGCRNYNFMDEMEKEVKNQQCDCLTALNCCTTSNPCLNGGTCLLPLPNSRKRFRCKCPDGYTGDQCEIIVCTPGYTGERCKYPVRSCRGYSNGTRIPGNYSVFDTNNKTFKVFCDFDKNSSMTWTLILSYSLDNNPVFKYSALLKNSPQNQKDPSWLKYRLSKSRMESIQQDSTKWRVTCRYETDGVVYTDYLRASNTQLNILSFRKHRCVKVEYINVRGDNCTECTAYLFQQQRMLHYNSYKNNKFSCDFKHDVYRKCFNANVNKSDSEHNFGVYNCRNPQHRCSSSGEATTQTWFGGQD